MESRELSWAVVELILHTLEDVVVRKLVTEEGLAGIGLLESSSMMKRVLPPDALTSSNSLKAYARSLSHELRTPMQGVVGTLDLMLATIQEAITEVNDTKFRKILELLKDNIEVVHGMLILLLCSTSGC